MSVRVLAIAERITWTLVFFIAGMLLGAFLQWDSSFFFQEVGRG